MASNLSSIPAGTNVLIDTNIFVYGLMAQSAECASFLQRCSNEEVFGISLFDVVHEATHRFMVAEARAKGLYTNAEKGAKYLVNHPEQVKLLTAYWANTQRLLALNIAFLQMEEKIVSGAQPERANAGLLTIDSIIVSTMREYGIVYLASKDKAFDNVAGISVFAPTDV